jgi:predicted enzyme related to lactoylglutathione lyase
MDAKFDTIIYPVRDRDKAKRLFETVLGVAPYMDQPYYVGFRDHEVEIGLDPNGHSKGLTGPIGYWRVDDIDIALNRLIDAGAKLTQPTSDVGGGKLTALVTDLDGNVIGLIQPPRPPVE